jgi:hypothetical protein
MPHSTTCTGCPECPGGIGHAARRLLTASSGQGLLSAMTSFKVAQAEGLAMRSASAEGRDPDVWQGATQRPEWRRDLPPDGWKVKSRPVLRDAAGLPDGWRSAKEER